MGSVKAGVDNCFWTVHMSLYGPDETDAEPYGASAQTVRIIGLDTVQIDGLLRRASRKAFGDQELPPGEWVIVGLLQHRRVGRRV